MKMGIIPMEPSLDRKVPQEIHNELTKEIEDAGGWLKFLEKAKKEGKVTEYGPFSHHEPMPDPNDLFDFKKT